MRVPVIGQLTATDCGAACLAMVLHARGRPVALGELGARLGAGRDGLSALALLRVAAGYGVAGRGLATPAGAIGRLPLPAIVHWQGRHFVVVERVAARGIRIVDPLGGRRRLTREEFDAGYAGVALAFAPADPGAPQPAGAWRPATWRRLMLPFVLRRPGLLGGLLLASLVLLALGAAAPLTTKVVVDRAFGAGQPSPVTALLVGAAAVSLTAMITTYARGALLTTLAKRTDADVTSTLVTRLLALPYGYFARRGTGEILLRTGSAAALRETLSSQLLAALLDGGLVLCYLAVVTAADPVLGLAAVAFAAAQLVPVGVMGARMHELTIRAQLAEAECQTRLVEAVDGIATLKAAGAEGRVVERWRADFGAQLDAVARRSRLGAIADAGGAAMRSLGPVALLLLVAQRVADGSLTLGDGLALAALGSAALAPVSSLAAGWRTLQLSRSQLARMADVLDARPEPAAPVAPEPARVGRGEVTLSGLGFRYDPEALWALRELDLRIPAGRKVAIVGRSGCGKTTLVKLLVCLHQPTEGSLALDGIDAAAVAPASWRRHFGVVLQEPSLFSGTVRDNIALCKPGAGLDEIRCAAERAAVAADIDAMPMGFDTMLAEGGAGLSGGQCQRIALARALLPMPAVLVLDEATSHLDTATEATVERELRKLPMTRIVIAHRLSTVRDADLIVVMDAGRIVEQGTHDELLRAGGPYAAQVDRHSGVGRG